MAVARSQDSRDIEDTLLGNALAVKFEDLVFLCDGLEILALFESRLDGADAGDQVALKYLLVELKVQVPVIGRQFVVPLSGYGF